MIENLENFLDETQTASNKTGTDHTTAITIVAIVLSSTSKHRNNGDQHGGKSKRANMTLADIFEPCKQIITFQSVVPQSCRCGHQENHNIIIEISVEQVEEQP